MTVESGILQPFLRVDFVFDFIFDNYYPYKDPGPLQFLRSAVAELFSWLP